MDERGKQLIREFVLGLNEDELDSLLGSLEHANGLLDAARQQEGRTDMSWNQGNGYGYGGGDDVYGRLNNTKEIGGARFPFIGSGKHTLALAVLEEFPHQQDGVCVRGLFKVMATNNPGAHPVGSFVVKIWKVQKPAKFPTQPNDGDKFADFGRKLKNQTDPRYPIGNDLRVLMKERPADQLARGTIIEAVGVPNKKGDYVDVYWNPIEQTAQAIAQLRQQLEAEGLPDTGPQRRPQQQGQQQYQQQQPGQYQPQYGGQTPTPGQYGPPTTAAPMQPSQGAPQGGFLAQIPPPGQGPQGGNSGQGGGSW